MKHEFHAQFPFALKDSATQAFAISVLVGKREEHPSWKAVHQLQNTFEGINLLAQSIITPYKEQARIGTRRDPGGYYYWIKHKADAFLKKQVSFINSIGLSPTLPNLSLFPFSSWALEIYFALKNFVNSSSVYCKVYQASILIFGSMSGCIALPPAISMQANMSSTSINLFRISFSFIAPPLIFL
jgi:hypothetical protein